MWGEDTGFLRLLCGTRGWGAYAAPRSRYAGECPLCGAGVLVQLRGHATRGSAPSAALGRLEDGAPATRDRLRCWGSAPRGAPTTIDTGALRTEPPLRVTAFVAENASSYRPLRELMTFVMCRS